MYNLLIVDDEPAVLEGILSSLEWEEHGIEIMGAAANGEEALRILSHTHIHIVLTDLRMPVMGGLDLIRQVKETHPGIRFIILSGFDDFDYIKEAIRLGVEDYLLKPLNKDELSSALLTAIEKIENDLHKYIHMMKDVTAFKENLLHRWVTHSISHYEFRERAMLSNIQYSSPEYAVAVVRILDAASLKDMGLAAFSVWNICDEVMNSHSPAIVFRNTENDVIFIFYGEQLYAKAQELRRGLQACLDQVSGLLKIKVFMTLGCVIQGYTNVHESYTDAVSLQNYSLILPCNNILSADDISKPHPHQDALQIDFSVFRNLVTMKRLEEAVTFIEELIAGLGNTGLANLAAAKNTILELLFHLSDVLKNSARRAEELPEDLKNLFSGFDTVRSNLELEQWLKAITCKAIRFLEVKVENTHPLVKQVLDSVHAGYSKDISLKTLSAQYNVNTSYLGQLFKNETGEMFTDYLNNVRIERAKELIAGTPLKMNEIAERVGYTNQGHFFRSFKKLTGLSPAEYKELCVNTSSKTRSQAGDVC